MAKPNKLNQQTADQIVRATETRLVEMFDSYIVIGVVAGTRIPITVQKVTDDLSGLAIQQMIERVVVPLPSQLQPPDEDAQLPHS